MSRQSYNAVPFVTMEPKKKLQLKHENSLFTLQTFHYNYYWWSQSLLNRFGWEILTRIIQRPLSAVATVEVNEAIDSEWNITTGLFGLEKYMLFKGSNNLVQIYRLFVITGNYGRRSFSKYGISDYDAYDGWCKHSRLNRQIWYRHPNNEAGNDEIQNVLVNMDFYFVGITF